MMRIKTLVAWRIVVILMAIMRINVTRAICCQHSGEVSIILLERNNILLYLLVIYIVLGDKFD